MSVARCYSMDSNPLLGIELTDLHTFDDYIGSPHLPITHSVSEVTTALKKEISNWSSKMQLLQHPAIT